MQSYQQPFNRLCTIKIATKRLKSRHSKINLVIAGIHRHITAYIILHDNQRKEGFEVKHHGSKPRYAGCYYDTINAPDFDHLCAIVDITRRAVYINRAAKPGANLIQLIARRADGDDG